MHVVLLGGSGFIGTALARALTVRGDVTTILTRSANRISGNPLLRYVAWDGHMEAPLAAILEGASAVVNLLGENIADKRWSNAQKERLVQSRVQTGSVLVSALQRLSSPPRTLIQASAVGYYGFWNENKSAPLCTEDRPAGQGFLAKTAVAWEASTEKVHELGIRRCVIRTAPVLGANGGLVRKMLPVYRLGLGGPVGTGRQPFAWIHLNDEVRAITFLLDSTDLAGAFNLVSPNEVNMWAFARALGRAVHRPAWLPVPGFLVRLALGEMADELLLSGQKVQPKRLIESGYIFTLPELEDALRQCLNPTES